ncbi:helix-turn-helix domain-containing protein [Niabella sp. CC-SYL272]|uniref:AraC family transcriptional regulator n=1 Tax=Niabella agricola TaxID=2891571 RepID=UPI001F18353F|nr:helix-turn-helix domain-containing protein [Niabella agricola]MCF3111214.1 helix-turn-helix domain-containing protein [Niabella agricola]
MQVPPSDILKPFIRHYLFLDINGAEAEQWLRFFPDGSSSLVLTFGARLYRPAGTETSMLPEAFLYGARSTYEEVLVRDVVRIVAIVFRPDGLYRLLGIPALQLKDRILLPDTALGTRIQQLYDRLYTSGIATWSDILNHFWSTYAMPNRSDGIVTAALCYIHNNAGIISSGQLTRLLGYSERQVERKFLFETGNTPSAYAGILRIHRFLKYLEQHPNESLTRLAYNARYADQSHLIKAFRKVTGLTPTGYLNADHKLARNFIGSVAGNSGA